MSLYERQQLLENQAARNISIAAHFTSIVVALGVLFPVVMPIQDQILIGEGSDGQYEYPNEIPGDFIERLIQESINDLGDCNWMVRTLYTIAEKSIFNVLESNNATLTLDRRFDLKNENLQSTAKRYSQDGFCATKAPVSKRRCRAFYRL